MSCRISRIVKRLTFNLFLSRGRKPRVQPMGDLERRVQAELHRRRDEIQQRKRDSRP